MQEMLEKKVTAGLTASAVFSRSVRTAPEKTNKKRTWTYMRQNGRIAGKIRQKKGDRMRILGIDPGYAIMGYGILDYRGNKFTPVAYGSILTEAHTPNEERLMKLYDELTGIIAEYQPDEASIEELFYNTNATTAIMVGEARGMALLACAKAGIKINEYTPLQIKSSLTGYGRADKKQVQTMVKMILGLAEVPKPDDTADALAAAICHAHHAGSRIPR